MQTQTWKRLIMLIVLAVFTTVIAHAQGSTMSVTIPFDFAVAGKTLPAGEYYFQRNMDNSRVVTQIRSRERTLSIYLPQTHPVQDLEVQLDSKSKLVFNKYGDQFFLSQVWIFGRKTGEELPKTVNERRLQREMARRAGKPEKITLAAKTN